MGSLKCKPINDRCTPWPTPCLSHTDIKSCCGNWLYPQCCWVVDFDVGVAMAKSDKHSDVARALELCFERDGLTTVVILGCVSNVGLSSLKDNGWKIKCQWINTRVKCNFLKPTLCRRSLFERFLYNVQCKFFPGGLKTGCFARPGKRLPLMSIRPINKTITSTCSLVLRFSGNRVLDDLDQS